MTFDQIAILGLLGTMLVAYSLDRFRIELVAMAGLAAAFLLGLIPVQDVFSGFSSPAVITVIEILLVVSVLARSRAIDAFAGTIVAKVSSERAVLAILCGTAAMISVFMNNVGALALMFPVTLSVCARLDLSPAKVLMPLSFATLMGGLCSLTGTPANLIINDWKIQETGGGFAYFDLAIVGAPVVLAGLVWLVSAAPRFFRSPEAATSQNDIGASEFLSELRVPTGSRLAGLSLPEIENRTNIHIHGVVRDDRHVFARRENIILVAGDRVLAEIELDQLDALQTDGSLEAPDIEGDKERLEVVVMPDSFLLGSRLGALHSFADRDVQLVGLASRRRRIEGRFDDLQIGVGDVLVIAGDRAALNETIADGGLLALSVNRASRSYVRAWPSVLFFAAGIVATALGFAPPEIAFGGVVVAMAAIGRLRMRDALQDMNWTIILLLACMIPLGIVVEETGAARVLANHIVDLLPIGEPLIIVATVLLLAAAITPFVDNVSIAVILSPIAVGISARSGVPLDPLLIAVALGASLDFLTPFGHHNNAIVMGAAGYRFVDFPKFGAPLLLICLFIGFVGIAYFWIS